MTRSWARCRKRHPTSPKRRVSAEENNTFLQPEVTDASIDVHVARNGDLPEHRSAGLCQELSREIRVLAARSEPALRPDDKRQLQPLCDLGIQLRLHPGLHQRLPSAPSPCQQEANRLHPYQGQQSATDDFLVDSSSGGTVFTRVYIRKVGTRTTEAIFTGASISYDDSLWSLVYGGDPPAGTPTNPYENFRGFWTDATLLPDGDGWTQIAGLNSKSNPKWERMVSACPNKHRDITAYSATKDLDTIVFSTGQECFVFVAATGKLHSLSLDGEVPEINRIVVDEGGSSATFFHDGVQISKGSLSGDKLGEEIGVVPIEKKVSEVTSD